MRQWWDGLSLGQMHWMILSGVLALMLGGLAAGIVGCMYWPVLEPLVHIGFGTMCACLIAAIALPFAWMD